MVMVHCQDVTEQKQAELRVHTWNLELEDRIAARTRELAEANHDLRNEMARARSNGRSAQAERGAFPLAGRKCAGFDLPAATVTGHCL